jgi:hypothetical protein
LRRKKKRRQQAFACAAIASRHDYSVSLGIPPKLNQAFSTNRHPAHLIEIHANSLIKNSRLSTG